mmetsp:Transcript_15216/g.36842  ORF Transcript_15216/g.36842 Transcript_15216/m.36842 type:complete len:216 (-) Transcript_15216:423-1070(-)
MFACAMRRRALVLATSKEGDSRAAMVAFSAIPRAILAASMVFAASVIASEMLTSNSSTVPSMEPPPRPSASCAASSVPSLAPSALHSAGGSGRGTVKSRPSLSNQRSVPPTSRMTKRTPAGCEHMSSSMYEKSRDSPPSTRRMGVCSALSLYATLPRGQLFSTGMVHMSARAPRGHTPQCSSKSPGRSASTRTRLVPPPGSVSTRTPTRDLNSTS